MDLFGIDFTEAELYKLNIHELREIAREIGVLSPTTKKKDELVAMTLQIVYGEAPAKVQKSGAGRPVRLRQKPSRIIYDIQNQNQIRLGHPENKFTCQFVNPEDIFVDCNVNKKVASDKVEYDANENSDESFESFSDDTATWFVTGVVVSKSDSLILETDKNKAFDIDTKMAESYGLVAGDMIECLVNHKLNIVTSLLSINGMFIL